MAHSPDGSPQLPPETALTQVSQILSVSAAANADPSAQLFPLVYDELRRLAAARLSRLPPGQTLQPTALVHDAFLRLIGSQPIAWNSRGHFFGACAMAMRDILVEAARRKGRIKRGGNQKKIELTDDALADDSPDVDLVALDEALKRLAADDPRKSQIVMLRYFAGLSIEETADALNISPATVKREWNFARAWLYDAISEDD